ncbi:unnamed protein product [Parajaminaea phylloscopi]
MRDVTAQRILRGPCDDQFRPLQPVIASSSPPREHPSTPPSPSSSLSPSFQRAGSTHDPFAATSKADLFHHPSFSKETPHVKHPHTRRPKRSLPNSPNLPNTRDGGPAGVFTASSMPWMTHRSQAKESNVAGGGYCSSSSSSIKGDQRDRILGQLYAESSEDAPTSDDHLEAVPWSAPSSDLDDAIEGGHPSGLGIDGHDFREQGSPTSGRRLATSRLSAGLKRQSISRSSSVTDPLGAFQTRSSSGVLHAFDHRPSAYRTDGSPQKPPAAQRRRLAGTSPKKPSGSTHSPWKSPHLSDSDDEGISKLVRSARSANAPPRTGQTTMAHLWHKVVESVWDSGETAIDVSNRQIDSVHPIIADLSNYVAIDPPRAFESTSSTASAASLPSHMGGHSRQSSSRSTFVRTVTSTGGAEATSTPEHRSAETRRGAGKGKPELYLMGNTLTKLPSALFEVGNLRVLSLRNNRLTYLPAAIGDLRNLRELIVAGNSLQYLPAEIQKLHLVQFVYFPNSFLLPPQGARLQARPLHALTGAVMASRPCLTDDEAASLLEESDEELEMTDAFLATAGEQDEMSHEDPVLGGTTPLGRPVDDGSRVRMGPPAPPLRFAGERGPAGVGRLSPANVGRVAPRRVFDRTRSERQVADLWSRGGGSMATRREAGAVEAAMLTPTPSGDADGDEAMQGVASATVSPPVMTNEATNPSAAKQVARCLGPLERSTPCSVPTLRELCIRRLLSPCEASRSPPSFASADDTAATITANTATQAVATERSVLWTRVPSSSAAFQFRYQNGRRPFCLLESYENGALRDLETGAQMEAGTIRVLEAARRSMEGKWGSGSGISGLVRTGIDAASGYYSRTPRGQADSWCKGAAGIARVSDGEEADSSSLGSEGEDAAAAAAAADDDDEGPTKVMSPPGRTCAAPTASSPRFAPMPVLDVSTQLDTQGDDCAKNPYFNRCPNPCHSSTHTLSAAAGVGASGAGDSLTRDYPLAADKMMFAPLYESAMETRLEWVSHIGGVKVLSGSVASATAAEGGDVAQSGVLPVLWRGCGRGCLAFLDAA